MQSIQPTLQYVDGFRVKGFSVKTRNKDEFNDKTAKIPSLWQQFHSSNLANNSSIFEVYSAFESDANGLYIVTIGINGDNKEEEFSSVDIQQGNYLIFKAEGPMPFTVIETWKQIWAYFEETTEYQRSFISDFESYNGISEVAIYIGIK